VERKMTQPSSSSRRVAWVEGCDIQGSGSRRRGHIWNLSRTGAYLVADPIPAAGEHIQISFRLPDGSRFEGEAQVAWRNEPSLWKGCGSESWKLPPGCGLEFLTWLCDPEAAARPA